MSTLWSAVWIGILAVAACSDDPAPPGAGGDDAGTDSLPAQVVVDTAPASVIECPHGGTIVLSGIDDNHNHHLDEREVRSRTPVCDAAAPTVVVRIVAEPAGDDRPCKHGGTAVQSGPDTNANGALDDDEVAHTDLLCGALLATRFRSEPAGAHCRDGGVAFEVGPDANDNGMLDNGEVVHTDFSCGDIVARSVTVGSAADAAALAHIRVIVGQLAVTAADSVALPDLEHLIGDLAVVDNAQLAQLRMARLADVSGSLRLRNAAQLATLALPALARIGGDLELRKLAVLPDMNGMLAVTSVAGAITFDDNAALASLHMPIGGATGSITVTDNPALKTLRVVSPGRMGPVVIRNNGLETVTLTALDASPADSEIGPTTITANPKLISVDMFSDALGPLHIASNPELASVDVTVTHVDGDVILDGNPKHRLLRFTRHAPGNPGGSELRFAGSLIIDDPIFDVPLFGLFSVGGDLRISGTQLSGIFLLTSVGGGLTIENNPNLRDVDFPLTPRGDVVITGNPLLANLDFLQNAAFEGNLTIRDNAALARLPSLGLAREFGGDLTIENNPVLRSAFTGAINAVFGRLRVAGNPVLAALPLDELGFAGTLEIEDNAALAAIALPQTTAISTISIRGNAAAQHLAVPQLRFTSEMTVDDNPQLPSCEVAAAFQRIITPDGSPPPRLEQHGNDDAKVCVPDASGAP